MGSGLVRLYDKDIGPSYLLGVLGATGFVVGAFSAVKAH